MEGYMWGYYYQC